MRLETFFEKFELLADAPDAVERLRELILGLASIGRLVEQDPKDPPGEAALLGLRIAKQRKAELGIARLRETDGSIDAGGSVDLPPTWARSTIGEVCELQTGATPSRAEPHFFGGDTRWLVSGDVNQREIFECEGRITDLGIQNSNCKLIAPNSVLIALNGQGRTRGMVAMLRVPAALNQSLVSMTPYSSEHLLPDFIYWNLRGRYYAIRDITGQDQRRGLNMKLIGQLTIPIPPTDEQKRIVAKVDQLMALCDRLEAQQQERQTRHAALARASLARFANAPTPENLEFLFHESFAIECSDLRMAVLTLGIQGRLVRQDPTDEPSRSLVSRIAIERRRFAQKHGFRPFEADPVDEALAPFEIPSSWSWCWLGQLLGAITDGDHLPPPRAESGVAFLTIGNMTTGRLIFDGARQVPDDYFQRLATFRRPVRGDILYSVVGATYGRPALVETDRPFCVQRHIAILKPVDGIEVGYLMAFLQSPLAYGQASASITGTAQPTVPLGALRNFVVPVPPLAEQGRIVAKIQQLTRLVYEADAQVTAARNAAAGLLNAVVGELIA